MGVQMTGAGSVSMPNGFQLMSGRTQALVLECWQGCLPGYMILSKDSLIWSVILVIQLKRLNLHILDR